MNTDSLLCTFTVDGLDFGVEVQRVQEVIRHQAMTPVPLAPREIAGLINLRGQIVTALDLRRRLGVPDRPAGRLPMNVVMRTEDEAVSMLVDTIGDVVDVSDIPFETPPETLEGPARELIRGAYKLEDRLLLFLDAERALAINGVPA